jgi:hypothetical protein
MYYGALLLLLSGIFLWFPEYSPADLVFTEMRANRFIDAASPVNTSS